MTAAVQKVFDKISACCPGALCSRCLIASMGKLIRSRTVRDAVWDCLVAWDAHVRAMPEGIDRDCQEELLRFAKGQMKAWRWWFLREQEASCAEGPEKLRLQHQLRSSRVRFSKVSKK